MMNLREGDLLLDTVLKLPTLDSPFECSANRVGHMRRATGRVVLLFEPIEQGIRFESPILLESCFDFRPKLLERIGTSPVRPHGTFDLAGQQVFVPILADRLFTHLQPPCGPRHRFAFM